MARSFGEREEPIMIHRTEPLSKCAANSET